MKALVFSQMKKEAYLQNIKPRELLFAILSQDNIRGKVDLKSRFHFPFTMQDGACVSYYDVLVCPVFFRNRLECPINKSLRVLPFWLPSILDESILQHRVVSVCRQSNFVILFSFLLGAIHFLGRTILGIAEKIRRNSLDRFLKKSHSSPHHCTF